MILLSMLYSGRVMIAEDESWYAHAIEGCDDSPVHIRTMITHTRLTIPIDEG